MVFHFMQYPSYLYSLPQVLFYDIQFFFKFYCRILPVEVNFLLKFGRVITYNTS